MQFYYLIFCFVYYEKVNNNFIYLPFVLIDKWNVKILFHEENEYVY